MERAANLTNPSSSVAIRSKYSGKRKSMANQSFATRFPRWRVERDGAVWFVNEPQRFARRGERTPIRRATDSRGHGDLDAPDADEREKSIPVARCGPPGTGPWRCCQSTANASPLRPMRVQLSSDRTFGRARMRAWKVGRHWRAAWPACREVRPQRLPDFSPRRNMDGAHVTVRDAPA